MKESLLEILSCPYDEDTHLELSIRKKQKDEIINGLLRCGKCTRQFPIIDGIPYLLPDELKIKNKEIIEFSVKNKEYKMRASQGYQADSDWQMGARVWKPDIFSKIMTMFRTKPPPDLISGYLKSFSSILDIGCGEHAKGNVNMDIYLPDKIPEVFIMASAEYLPFKSNVFDLVISSYVIEHCLNPSKFIINQIRCSKDKVMIVGDNCEWIGDFWFRLIGNGRIFHDEHCYAWTAEYLENLIRRIGYRSKVNACNLSPTYITLFLSKLGRLPRIGRIFYRDLMAEISKKSRINN